MSVVAQVKALGGRIVRFGDRRKLTQAEGRASGPRWTAYVAVLGYDLVGSGDTKEEAVWAATRGLLPEHLHRHFLWGDPYGGDSPSYTTREGVPVRMRRKGQRVRFFDPRGLQVGPEQPNVAPAVAYAMSQGWRSTNPRLAAIQPEYEVRKGVLVEKHESGKNPTTSQQAANRKKTPRRRDYGHGLHVEYSPGNAAYFVMWHHEVLSIRPTWESADEHARSLVANKDKDGSSECAVEPSTKAVVLRRTQSGEPPVVEHYNTMSEATGAAKRWMRENPPGEHGRVTIEARGRGEHGVRTFRTVTKNAFEWKWDF